MKTQEFHDTVAQENTDWAKKPQSILFAYRINKQASTHFSPFYMMYGRETLIPWQMENNLGPLDMSQELPDFTIEETIEKMENLHQQVLEVAAGNIIKAQAHQVKTYHTKHARNDFEVGAKVWKKNPLCNLTQKSLKKGPMWRGLYEVEGKTQAGNYLLKGVKDKGKGKVRNTVIPPNQLKRYIARSQNITAKSDDEYASESDGDDDQGPPIGTNSPVSSDAETILYADSEDDKGIPGHSSGVPIPGHTSSSNETNEIEIGQIPGHASSGNSDDTIEINVVREICTNNESPLIIESSSSNSPLFDDATLEEVDIDFFSAGNQLVYNLVFKLEGKVV